MFSEKWGFWGGAARDAENRKTDSGACDFQGGARPSRGALGAPPRSPRGAQKGRRTLSRGVLEAAIFEMYGFP